MPLNNPFKPNAGHGLLYSDEMTIKVNEAETFDWTGEHTFENNVYSQTIQPRLTDTYDLGTSTKLWRKGYLSELDAVLFAKQTISLLGGWLMIPKDAGTLAADVASADTTIDFGKAMTEGHFVVMRAALKVEYVQVGTLVSGTRYNVTRNLEGSGANDWAAGTPFAVLGTSGDGRIELNAYDTPRISLLNQGAAYNVQTEMLRIGDLNGNWGYTSQTWGVAVGEYASGKANITVDPTNGIRLRSYGTSKVLLEPDGDVFIGSNVSAPGTTHLSIFSNAQTYNGEAVDAGDLLIGDNSAGKANILWDKSTGKLLFRGGTTAQVEIGTDGILYAGAGKVKLSIDGLLITDGNAGASAIHWKNGTDTVGWLYCYSTTAGGDPQRQLFLESYGVGATDRVLSMLRSYAGPSSLAGVSCFADADAASTNYIELNVNNANLIYLSPSGLSFTVGGTSKFSVDLSGNVAAAGRIVGAAVPAARVYNNAAISVPNTTWTALTFNSERFDTDSIHDTSTNSSRLTCRTPGIYIITGNVQWALNTTGRREIGIRLNGSTFIALQEVGSAQNVRAMAIGSIWQLAVNDYVELMAYQDSGGALDCQAASAYAPEFSMVWVSA